MEMLNSPSRYQAKQISWEALLASIPDSDLDLLISAGEKMQRQETVLNTHELDACLRWYPQIDIRPYLRKITVINFSLALSI